MHCNLTLFRGFTGTVPVHQASDLFAQEVLSLMAGELIQKTEKAHVPYATPITFSEAPYIGRTAERMLKQGRTVGVQRSADHAQNCKAGHVLFDFDDLPNDQTARVIEALERAQSFAFTSHSHGKLNKAGNSFRAVFFLDEPITGVKNYQNCWRGIEKTFFPGLPDFTSSKPYQMQGCWATAPERVAFAWRKTNLKDAAPLSSKHYLSVGVEAIKQSPFDRAGIIGSAAVTPMPSEGLDPEVSLPPILNTPVQNEIFDAMCMLDSSSTELLIHMFGCLKAVGDEYQGHFETWVASNPLAVEKYKLKHPTKYNARHMWTQTNWRASITAECGFATIKWLARASAWAIILATDDENAVDVALTYLDRYHSRWLKENLEGKQ